ncbi:hypothetical protein KFK09_027166 [Dendrobium nobile]|uniref:RdRp catalytic domain-containing protein n=1 Tax=Dendrobium nobile TaxID=94219 RepID=A0A8T3A9N8_DENNO|nr:hypothetical protein KFK09_027166 [Dendrobium nobile]
MLDALEQAASSPLYNVLSKIAHGQLKNRSSGFQNSVVRASTDWMYMWEEIQGASIIVELDWKKFDRERPAEDILFFIDVVISCFFPQTSREERLLSAYRICMIKALIERPFISDGGLAFTMDGMVPSGSLWTGLLDTALNILYIPSALLDMGFTSARAVPKCCGDDNLTLFYRDPGDTVLNGLRSRLNKFFRAGIDEEDFFIHRLPYYVMTDQTIFHAGTDLKRGTSKIIDKARWEEFTGEI